MRLYGGWTDEHGIPSPAAFRLLQAVSALRGRRHGVIVRPSLAFAMCEFPGVILRGTVRMRSKNKRQKMVDGMLGCDAVFAAAGGQVPVGIVTDDDDLVPAALSAQAAGPQRVVWMRSRRLGLGLNDQRLSDLGLQIVIVRIQPMLDAQMSSEEWKSRIEFDLASFVDPGTTLDVTTESARSFRAAWTMRGKGRDAVFSKSPSTGVSVNFGGRNLSYREFIAGPDMANLRDVATMIFQASTHDLFVATRARSEGNSDTRPAVDLLMTLLDGDTDDATRVLMVTGDAGAGKTRVLQELVRRRAEDYLHGKTTKLLLYVNAQGRALARLNEALATELQDLRVDLTYHSVAVLAGLGVLVPVIDGFDELLGVSGYDDAFSSLAGFLEQLDGEGQLLVSARSVYYESEFLARSGNVSNMGGLKYVYSAVRVLEWSDEDRAEYLRKWGTQKELSDTDSERLAERVRVATGRHAIMLSKPLFFARTVERLWENPGFTAGEDLLQALVDEYLARERKEKLLGALVRDSADGDSIRTLDAGTGAGNVEPGDPGDRLPIGAGGRGVLRRQ